MKNTLKTKEALLNAYIKEQIAIAMLNRKQILHNLCMELNICYIVL